MTDRAAPELRLEAVSHVYQQGGVRALDEVSLTIGPGSWWPWSARTAAARPRWCGT